ncbi:DUF4352 domain-containing protein [Actinomadura sp.]|uniref:DUF4352 domain-containing protein n=1 Tax=Actinomadura sp. TaxID=1989 RepID=UPI0037CAA57F
MRLFMMRAAMSMMLITMAAACGTENVNTAPANNGGEGGSGGTKPAKKTAQVGDTVNITDDSSGVSLAVTLRKVVDPAEPGEFETLPNGKRLVAAQFKVKNKSDDEYQDAPANGARAIDTSGQAYEGGLLTATDCEAFAGAEVRLTKGESQRGCVTFEVGKKATIERIRFAASSGFGSAAEWKVG